MKNRMKSAACIALFRTGVLPKRTFSTRILAYHTVNPETFEMQMLYLKKNYHVVTLIDALKDIERKQVVITFDDGYRNNIFHAYPVLKKLGLTATLFVTYDFIEKNSFAWWDRLEHAGKSIAEVKTLHPDEIEKKVLKLTGIAPDGKKPEKYDFMSWDEVRKSMDVLDIGSHCMTHRILTNISLEEAEEEIRDSRERIAARLGKVIRTLAYPNGDTNSYVAGLAKKHGYECAVTYTRGDNSSADRFKLRRRGVNVKDSLEIFACKVAGVF